MKKLTTLGVLLFAGLLLVFTSCVSVNTTATKSNNQSTQKMTKALDLENLPKQEVDLSMYPKAEKGYERKIITLPKLENEANFSIEFSPGKEIAVDICNRHGFLGNLEEHLLKGWGYTYYTFDSNAEIISTQMACLDNEKVTKFITGERLTVNYNSKLPIVIYVPEGFEVRYHVWEKHTKEYLVK
ncbi:MAG: serine protease inhibitor ecotin [Mesonia hippocampi]|uniref:serine protease inhibitor ecotin n=1 Tax=Mesonia hippocampi TaxID=1628250 RepID=UPI003F983316